jgi:hypothetical protein
MTSILLFNRVPLAVIIFVILIRYRIFIRSIKECYSFILLNENLFYYLVDYSPVQ